MKTDPQSILQLEQVIMADIQLGCYTMKTHGAKVARLDIYDWIILILLTVIDGMLNRNIIEPFHRFVGKDMMTDLRCPFEGNTVPFWLFRCLVVSLSLDSFFIDSNINFGPSNKLTLIWQVFLICSPLGLYNHKPSLVSSTSKRRISMICTMAYWGFFIRC